MSNSIDPLKFHDADKTWFFSDPHFGHKNVLKFEEGYHNFSSIEEHDAEIIRRWNSAVEDDHTIFFLGDATMPRVKSSHLIWIFSQLRGKIVWLKGNHDSHIDFDLRKRLQAAANIVEFSDYQEIFIMDPEAEHETRRISMFHYPILEFNGKFRNAYHLYGHSHTTIHPIKNAYSVCACNTDYTPVNYEWVKRKISEHNEGLNRPGEPNSQSTD